MKIDEILKALEESKLTAAAELFYGDTDKMSMLVAIATGRVATYETLYELYDHFNRA